MKKNLTALYNSTEKASIACSEGNNNYAEERKAHGAGHYEQKAYNPTITIVCEFDDLLFRVVKAYDTKYEILCDGLLLNRYSSFKIAESYFMDFAGLTKAKYKKLAKVTTA